MFIADSYLYYIHGRQNDLEQNMLQHTVKLRLSAPFIENQLHRQGAKNIYV